MCNFVVSLLTNDEPTLFDTHVKGSFYVGVVAAQFELLIDVLLRCCASNSARNSASNSASNVQFSILIHTGREAAAILLGGSNVQTYRH